MTNGRAPDARVHRFGRNVRVIRLEAKITQQELATRSGLTDDLISRVERGEQPGMRLSTALRLVDALQVTSPSITLDTMVRTDRQTTDPSYIDDSFLGKESQG